MKHSTTTISTLSVYLILTCSTCVTGQAPAPQNPNTAQTFSPPRFVNSATEQDGRSVAAIGQISPGEIITAQTAQISCIHKIQMAAQADGLIKELLVDEGSVISKGDPVMIIDSRVAEAELEVAQKQLESASIIAAQTANIEFSEAARDLAIEEYASEKELYLKNSTTQSALKRKHLEMRKTMFSVDMANDEQRKYQLEAAIAKEQVNASKVKLELYRVVAPYDGIIVERKRDLGEWIRAGEPVLRMVHMNEMKVEAFVPLDGISLQSLEGADMNIRVSLGPTEEVSFQSKVGYVSPELDTRTVRVTTRIQNQFVGNSWILRDGMQARVEIIPAR